MKLVEGSLQSLHPRIRCGIGMGTDYFYLYLMAYAEEDFLTCN